MPVNDCGLCDNLLNCGGNISKADFYTLVAKLLCSIESTLTCQGQTEYNNGDSGTAINIDWCNGSFQALTLTDDVTLTFVDPSGTAARMDIRLIQDASGGHDVTWPGNVVWPEGEPTWSTGTAGQQIIVTLRWDGSQYIAIATSYY